MKDLSAVKALIVALSDRWPGSRMTGANVDAYANTLLPFGIEAVSRAVEDAAAGRIEGSDPDFMPSAARLALRAKVWADAIAYRDREPEVLHSGLLEMDFGRGKVNMRGLTVAQQDAIIAGNGVVHGVNVAYLPRADLVKLLDGKQLELVGGRAAPVPRLRRMAE